ncbi:substrate-binding domain-containing protein [Butyrivibrio sp. FCS014]|uniref:substrate-binding domain-containing protein n=1 Tax=Butyrivibrio sp. FCS014 TaxID=1408304 RepID=UPI000463FC69|nr:substrate-binding domain-containing protein [Butyrivibrio sp. FCS014]
MGKILKRFVIFLLTGAMIVGLMSGCGINAGSKPAGKIKIGVTLYDQYDTFISQLMECFTDLVEDNVEVAVYNASNSQQTQNTQVRKMIEDGCNVICVNLVDRTDPTAVIDAARKADVPIIFFNRELVEGDMGRWNKLFYVGANAIESGILEGELAAEAIKNDASIDRNGDGVIQFVVLEGEAGHQDSIVRTEYSVDTMIKAGIEVDKLGYAIANWNRAQAQTKMSQLIEQSGDSIELVLSNNDDMALGAIDAYEAAGVLESAMPVFFGIDGTDVGLEAVAQGKLKGTVYNDKEGQAGAMYSLAMTLARGGSIADLESVYEVEDGKYIRLPYTQITDDNIAEYLNKAVKSVDEPQEDPEGDAKGEGSGENSESAEGAPDDYPMFKQVTYTYDRYYEGDLVDENYYGDDKDHRLLYYADEQYLLVTEPSKNAYPELSKFLEERVIDRAAIADKDEEGTLGDIDVLEGYEDSVSRGGIFPGPWYDMQRENIALLNDKILSFVTYYENYAGGAHGYHYKAGTTVNVSTGKKYELKEILNISDEQLRGMIRDRIKIEDAEDYKDYWDLDDSLANYFIDPDSADKEKNSYINHYNWTMEPEGMHFFFNPYDLAAYGFGIIEATVPYEMLGDFPGKELVLGSKNDGFVSDEPLYPESSKWDSSSDSDRLSLYYVPGEEGEGLAKGLYLKKGNVKASFDESFMMEDEKSISTRKVVTGDGREYLYVTSKSLGYYYDFFAFEITDGIPRTCGRAVFCKTGLEVGDDGGKAGEQTGEKAGEQVGEEAAGGNAGDKAGEKAGEGAAGGNAGDKAGEGAGDEGMADAEAVGLVGEGTSGGVVGELISEGAAIDAKHLYFGEINTIIGDFVLVGQYSAGEDGMPVFTGNYKYVTECSDHITLKKDLKVEVVDEAGNVVTAEEMLPDGTHVMPFRTAEDKLVDCYLDDGRIARIIYSRDGDEPDIDGEYLMDIFEGESYIG